MNIMRNSDRKRVANHAILPWIFQVAGSSGKIYIGLLLMVQALLGISSVGYAVVFRGLVDEAVAKNRQGFVVWTASLVVLVLVQLALSAVNRFLQEYSRSSVENCFKERLLSCLLDRDYGQVTRIHSGEWMNRLTSDTVVVADGLTQILPGAGGMLVRMAGAVGTLIYLYPAFGYILIPGGLVLIATSYAFRRVLKGMHRKVQEADGDLRVFLQESLSGMLVVRAFAREDTVLVSAGEQMEKHRAMRMRKNHFSNLCNIGFGLIMNGAYVIGGAVGGYGILTGTMTYGTLMAIVQLIGQIQSPFANITGYLPKYYAMLASAERLREVEDFDREESKTLSLQEVQRFYSEKLRAICLKDAGFTYRPLDGENLDMPVVLDGLDLEILRGSYVAFTGPSGCGKSTILRLVAGLIKPTTGTVTVDDKEVTEPSPERGMVFQKPTLFPWLTVEKNIGFSLKMQGKLKGNEDKVKRMIEIIGLENFKDDYPEQLSGGMAQRVALVRSLINEPDILLLDEPLGALDAFTRMNMQDEILKIWSEKQQLAIMVTHDVDEAIYMGTRVIVMEANPGRIVDDIRIEQPYPRKRSSEEFVECRNRILNRLHFGGNS
mgnify:CR=1 FL=1